MDEYTNNTNAAYPTRGRYIPMSGNNTSGEVNLFSGESSYIGLDPDFQYNSFGKTLNRSDNKETYKDVLTDLANRIINYGKANTPEEKEELSYMASDYMKLSEHYYSRFGESIHAMQDKDIRESENADILAKAYCETQNGSRGYATAEVALKTIACTLFGGVLVSLFAGIGIGLICAGVAAAIGGTVVLSIKAADLIRQKRAENAAKRIVSSDARKRIKESKNQIKKARKRAAKLKFEHLVKWLKAGTKENRKKVNQEYSNLSSETKRIISDNKKIIKAANIEINEKVNALPQYSDYAYKEFLYQAPEHFMAEEANRKYNEFHGINQVKTTQAQQNMPFNAVGAERVYSPMVSQQAAHTVKPTQLGNKKSSGAGIKK